MPTLRVAAAILVVLLTAPIALSSSQDDQKEILGYKLSTPVANKLLSALPEMNKHLISLPNWQSRVARSMNQSLGEITRDTEQDPKAMVILKKNGLTAKEYVVGIPALRMALMAVSLQPADAKKLGIAASPENIAFAKANSKELKSKLDAADGLLVRR